MDIREYKDAVIELFRSGTASDEQWERMANAVLYASERCEGVECIDRTILAGEIADATFGAAMDFIDSMEEGK